MKYLTQAWYDLDDHDEDQGAEYRETWRRYLATIEALDPRHPVRVFRQTVSLHDAYVDRVTYERATGDLSLLLLTGDLDRGYFRTSLIYAGAAAVEGETVLRKALAKRPMEVMHDEFTQEDGRWRHSFLLVPWTRRGRGGDSFSIAFDSFRFVQQPAGERTLATASDQSRWS